VTSEKTSDPSVIISTFLVTNEHLKETARRSPRAAGNHERTLGAPRQISCANRDVLAFDIAPLSGELYVVFNVNGKVRRSIQGWSVRQDLPAQHEQRGVKQIPEKEHEDGESPIAARESCR